MVIQKTDQIMQAVQNENLQKSAGKRNRREQNTQNTKKNVDGRFLIEGSSKEQIEKKRKLAQKQAMKLVKDAFSGDQATKQNIEDLKAQKAETVAEYQEKMQQIGNISAEKDKLRETYGIAQDSQEQRDLELLEKYQNNKLGIFTDDFSKEEIDRLKELANEPRTEYQKQVLSLNGKKAALQSDADLMQQQIMVLTQNQSDAKVDQLKSQDMLKAGDAAEEIQKAASDEIVGMVIADAKEKLDKELEEKKEEAEKKTEEKEEQDERIEKAKEERKEDREMIEGDLDAEKLQADASLQKQSVTQSEETTQRINQIMKKNHLINEDLKGIEIDVNF